MLVSGLTSTSFGCEPTACWRWAVTFLNGAHCNAQITSGCGAAPRQQAVGSQPTDVQVNPLTGTVYVTTQFQTGPMSIVKAVGH